MTRGPVKDVVICDHQHSDIQSNGVILVLQLRSHMKKMSLCHYTRSEKTISIVSEKFTMLDGRNLYAGAATSVVRNDKVVLCT